MAQDVESRVDGIIEYYELDPNKVGLRNSLVSLGKEQRCKICEDKNWADRLNEKHSGVLAFLAAMMASIFGMSLLMHEIRKQPIVKTVYKERVVDRVNTRVIYRAPAPLPENYYTTTLISTPRYDFPILKIKITAIIDSPYPKGPMTEDTRLTSWEKTVFRSRLENWAQLYVKGATADEPDNTDRWPTSWAQANVRLTHFSDWSPAELEEYNQNFSGYLLRRAVDDNPLWFSKSWNTRGIKVEVTPFKNEALEVTQ